MSLELVLEEQFGGFTSGGWHKNKSEMKSRHTVREEIHFIPQNKEMGYKVLIL